MTNTLKTFFTLFVVLGFLAGCSSTPTEIEEPIEDTPIVEDDTSDNDYSDPVEETISADTIFYFDYDQAMLKSDSRAALMIHAEQLKSSPRSIRLEGHADERGSREYNMALGERRANAVRDFLVLQGVDSYLIETVSYGEERPAAVSSDEGSWAQNRRVELR